MSDDREPLQVTRTDEADRWVVIVEGELDPHTAPLLEAELDAAVAGEHDTVVLDLAQVAFIDSSGLRLLIGAQNRLRDADRSLVLRSPSPAAVRLLQITGLGDRLTVES